MMNRQQGANLSVATRSRRVRHSGDNRDFPNTIRYSTNPGSNEISDYIYPSTWQKYKRNIRLAWNVVTLKNLRSGVTGRIQFTATIIKDGATFQQKGQHIDQIEVDRKSENKYSKYHVPPIHPIPLIPPIPPPPISCHGEKQVNVGLDFRSKRLLTVQPKSLKTYLFLEIESCLDLRASMKPWRRNLLSPFVIVRLNQHEVGRTPAVRLMKNPIWYDECFRFPICEECSTIYFEVWGLSPSETNGSSAIDVGEFMGGVSLDIATLVKSIGKEDFQQYDIEIQRWRETREKERTTSCPLQGEVCIATGSPISSTYNNIDAHLPHHETDRMQPSMNFNDSKKQRCSIVINEAANNSIATEMQSFKVVNPHPFRRKGIREIEEFGESESVMHSTSFKAISLICIYLIVGVTGYSYIFERWSIRDSLYFSVVTFTTVGYGDVRPTSSGGKLFACLYAIMGIGIIGIALGYIGQNLVQAQILALQRTQKKGFGKKNRYRNDTEEKIEHKDRQLVESKNVFQNIVICVCPIIAIISLGSIVVGAYEKWSWVDSIYWCIITGTSVGYGDFVPKTEKMRWFSIFFIPLTVGVVYAALGRIANIFVEQEIQKSNTKLLTREVTLEDLEDMNMNGDGEVSLQEFVEHMLKSMNKVDQRLLDELHRQFERLDADGSGGLQQDDLELLAERALAERRSQVLMKYRTSLHEKLVSFPPSKVVPNN